MISTEQLVHFQCCCCSKWWTIGDAPINEGFVWFCPWCGVSQNEEGKQVANGFNTLMENIKDVYWDLRQLRSGPLGRAYGRITSIMDKLKLLIEQYPALLK